MRDKNLIGEDEAAGDEEAGSCRAIQKQEDARGKKNAESEQAKNRGHKPCPDRQRLAHQGHALRAKIHGGRDEVERTHQ